MRIFKFLGSAFEFGIELMQQLDFFWGEQLGSGLLGLPVAGLEQLDHLDSSHKDEDSKFF